jgi:iron complex outermembrane recepter protein
MMKTTFSCVGALALASCFLSGAADAADGGDTVVSTLIVEGRRPGSLSRPGVDQQKADLLRTPGSVGFVAAEDFQQRFANSLRDVLKDTPGVFIQERYGKEMRLSVRGSGLARGFHLRGIELSQDGVPFNMADGSGDFYEIDPLALRSVEVFKGGNGLAYGASTLGGAVNAVTATALTAQSPAWARLDGGSFETVRGAGQLSLTRGAWDALGVVSAGRSDGPRAHSGRRDVFLNANLGYRPGEAIENRLYLTVIDSRQRLPGALSLSDALRAPETAAPAAIAGDQARNQSVQRLADRISLRTGAAGRLDADAWLYHKRLYHPIFQVIDQDGATWGAQARWSSGPDLAGRDNELIAGARIVGGVNNARQYVNLAGRRGALTADADQKALNLEAYAEDRLRVAPALTVMVGAKAVSARRELVNFTTPSNSAVVRYAGVSPRLGALWQAARGVQVFADLTRSRDIPDFSDLAQVQPSGATGFVPLEPQRAWTGEVGARGRSGRLAFDLTLYRAEIRGELVQFSIAPDVPAQTFNADRTVHQGVEAWASYDLAGTDDGAGDRLSLTGLWNFNDFRFAGDGRYGDNAIAGAPRNQLRAELRYLRPRAGPLRDLYLTPQADWTPQGAWADQANTLRAPGYVLIGLEAGFVLPNGLQVFLEGRNLTDRAYVSDVTTVRDARVVSTAIFYPGDGRSLYAGVKAAF